MPKEEKEDVHEEESELEEDLEEAELNLQNLEFQQFVQPETSSPSFERVAGGQERPIFVGGIPQGVSETSTEEERGGSQYLHSTDTSDEPKYAASERIATASERVDPLRTTIQTTPDSKINQQPFFNQFSEQAQFQSQPMETFERADRIDDVSQAGRKDPFEPEDKKYDPDLPSR